MGIDTDIFIGHSLSISQLLRLPHVLEAEYARPDSPLRAIFWPVRPDEQFFAWPAFYFRDRRCWMVDPEAEIEETGSSTIELPSGLHVHVTRAFLDIGPGERWFRFLTIPELQAKTRAASRKIAELVGAHHVLYCADGMAHLWREGDVSLRKPAGDLFYEGLNFDDVVAWIRSQDLPLWTEFPPAHPINEDIDEQVVWILEAVQ